MGKHTRTKLRLGDRLKSTQKPVIDEKVRQERVVPLIAALKSINANQRSSALSTIAGLIEDLNVRHMLLRERLVKTILGNTLSDTSLEIVSQGLGVLRNVVLSEGRDVALFLVREQIKLPLNSISSKAHASLNEDMDDEQRKILDHICENTCGLSSALTLTLGELSGIDEVLKLAWTIASSASKFDGVLSPRSIEAAFEILYYSSENSEELVIKIIGKRGIDQIKKITPQAHSWPVRIYGLGLECNLWFCSEDDDADPAAVAQKLASYLLEIPLTEANSIQVCLELLALSAQTDEDLELVSSLLGRVGDFILRQLLPNPVFRLHSVSVLNNIGWSLNALNQSWNTEASKIYENVLSSCFQDLEDTELVTAALGLVAAALVQEPQLLETHNFKDLVPVVLNRIDALYESKNEDWVALARSLLVVLAASKNTAVEMGFVDTASRLIFTLLEHSSDVEAHIDALNSLFDVFGDNEASYNQAEYNDKQLNKKLEQLKVSIKRVLKSPPKANTHLREQAIETLTNLENFIVYKRE